MQSYAIPPFIVIGIDENDLKRMEDDDGMYTIDFNQEAAEALAKSKGIHLIFCKTEYFKSTLREIINASKPERH